MSLTTLQVEARKHRAAERDRLGVVNGARIRAETERMLALIRAYAAGFKMGGWAHQCPRCNWKFSQQELDDIPSVEDARWIRHLCPCGTDWLYAMCTPKFVPFTGAV